MGLDITAYRGLTPVENAQDWDSDTRYDAGLVTLYPNPDFPDRSAPLLADVPYKPAEGFGFRAGSYGGYNGWRAELARLAGYSADFHGTGWDVPESGPFVELVNFSDCEGVLGPIVCAKLARDFAEWQERADQWGDAYWRQKYAEWRKAIEMAADGGAVSFH